MYLNDILLRVWVGVRTRVSTLSVSLTLMMVDAHRSCARVRVSRRYAFALARFRYSDIRGKRRDMTFVVKKSQ